MAHYGHPAFDVAFFSNHFILKAVKNKKYAPSYLNMLGYMQEIYFDKMDYMDKKQLENSYVRTLSLLMIARVDGKSPAEYITDDSDKDLVRKLGFTIINEKIVDYKKVIKLVLDNLS